jgi:hypothetical protein
MFDSTDCRNIVPAAGKANHALIDHLGDLAARRQRRTNSVVIVP